MADDRPLVERMEERGISMAWYYKSQKKKPGGPAQVTRESLRQDRCSILSAYYVKYGPVKGAAQIFSVNSADGSPYMQVRDELSKKSGDPIWWCTCCDQVFKTFPAFLKHFEQSEDRAEHA